MKMWPKPWRLQAARQTKATTSSLPAVSRPASRDGRICCIRCILIKPDSVLQRRGKHFCFPLCFFSSCFVFLRFFILLILCFLLFLLFSFAVLLIFSCLFVFLRFFILLISCFLLFLLFSCFIVFLCLFLPLVFSLLFFSFFFIFLFSLLLLSLYPFLLFLYFVFWGCPSLPPFFADCFRCPFL